MIRTNREFELEYWGIANALVHSPMWNRGPAHAMKDDSTALTHEIMHYDQTYQVGQHMGAWQEVVKPNLPWAEDHFQERIGGAPLNPAPSEAWWPFARQGNAEHKKEEVFSHTYPERIWPRFANAGGKMMHNERIAAVPHVGLRFEYGDLDDLIHLLKENPHTRQAYLPIWFPEDLNAACHRERVPCSIGYHFIHNCYSGMLDCVYTLRSCDAVRFFRDDIYMAGRLLQHVADETAEYPGELVVHISNLHCFHGDLPFLKTVKKPEKYDLGSLL